MTSELPTSWVGSTIGEVTWHIRCQIPLQMRRGVGDCDPSSDIIRVMTIKVRKGLEFPVVAVPSAGHMPAAGEGEVDTARVFYGAATRATQRLVIGVGGGSIFSRLLVKSRLFTAFYAVNNVALCLMGAVTSVDCSQAGRIRCR